MIRGGTGRKGGQEVYRDVLVMRIRRPELSLRNTADDFLPGRILDLVRPEMLAERVLVFEESPGEGFIDHGYGAGGGRVILQDDKGKVVVER